MSVPEKFRILLVNAPSLGVIEPWQDAPEFGRNALTYLAGYLRPHDLFDIRIIDAKLERLSFEEVIDRALDFRADVIGYTAFTNEIKPCAYLAYKIHQVLPGAVHVVGGAHVTALPVQTMNEFSAFDIGVVGEGEQTFLELCLALAGNQELDMIPGLVFRNSGRIVQTPPRERILDQDQIPMPAWDLLPRANVYWIQTQRGCPFKCVFCMNHNGRVARKTGIEKIMEEIEYVVDHYQPEWIRFGDEMFTVDMNRTMEFLDEMIRRGIGKKVKWEIQTHVNYVNYEMFRKFKEAGCAQIDLGVESGDPELLKKMGKGTDHAKILEAFDAAKRAGVTHGSFFLFGQPNETSRTIMESIKFAIRLNPDIPMFGMMVPYPGTKVAKLAANNEGGYLNLTYDWDQYRKQIGGAVTFANLSRRQAEFFQLVGYVSVFLFNFRFIDFFKFLFKYSSEALTLFWKMLTGKSGIEHILVKPADYDQVLNGRHATAHEMAMSCDDFDEYQKQELVRTKKLRPELIREQQIVSMDK